LRPILRFIAFGVLVVLVSLLGASCRDVVVGDSVDVVSTLCEELKSCYGDDVDCDELTEEMEGAAPAERAGYLESFDVARCTGTCPEVVACLDASPFCETAAGCGDANPCCGMSDGTSECRDGSCCTTRGAPCAQDGECCDGEPCRKGACGGRPCATPGAPCSGPDECCTGLCFEGECRKLDCRLISQECTRPEDCCSPEEQMLPPGTTIDCVGNVCTPVGQPACVPELYYCDEPAGLSCCAGLVCAGDPEAPSCITPGCVPVGLPCGGGQGSCCGDATCDLGVCTAVGGCAPEQATCSSDEDCCSNYCGDSWRPGFLSCQYCAAGTCHAPCAEGGAMDSYSCDGMAQDACVEAIALADPLCRCLVWDWYCVGLAADQCPELCAPDDT
jgi:hypothetical protein